MPGPQSSSTTQATHSPVARSQRGVAGSRVQSASAAQPLAPPDPEADVEAAVEDVSMGAAPDDDAMPPALAAVLLFVAGAAPPPVDVLVSTISMLPHAPRSAASDPVNTAARTK